MVALFPPSFCEKNFKAAPLQNGIYGSSALPHSCAHSVFLLLSGFVIVFTWLVIQGCFPYACVSFVHDTMCTWALLIHCLICGALPWCATAFYIDLCLVCVLRHGSAPVFFCSLLTTTKHVPTAVMATAPSSTRGIVPTPAASPVRVWAHHLHLVALSCQVVCPSSGATSVPIEVAYTV